MRLHFVIFMLTSLIKISLAGYVRYDNYRVYRIFYKLNEEILKFNKNEKVRKVIVCGVNFNLIPVFF